MPRYARLYCPGSAVHVITRFVNREYRLAGEAERAFYREALGRSLSRTDWKLLAYALMSSHVHLVFLAGFALASALLQSLQVRVAAGLNRRHGRLGPVFANRATIVTAPRTAGASIVIYTHNNPCRAGVVDAAADSTWTSHRAWLGLDPCPDWLHAELGLELCGFGADPAGRRAFDGAVRAHAGDRRDPQHGEAELARLRAETRATLGAPVELSSPLRTANDGVTSAILSGGSAVSEPPWPGAPRALVAAAAAMLGIDEGAIRSRSHAPRLVDARRLIALSGVAYLGLRVVQIATELGVSSAAVSQWLGSPKRPALEPAAVRLAGLLRTGAEPSRTFLLS